MGVTDGDAAPSVLSVCISGELPALYELRDVLAAAGWECSPPDPYGHAAMIRVERVQDVSKAAIDAAVAEIDLRIESSDAFIESWDASLDVGQLDLKPSRDR